MAIKNIFSLNNYCARIPIFLPRKMTTPDFPLDFCKNSGSSGRSSCRQVYTIAVCPSVFANDTANVGSTDYGTGANKVRFKYCYYTQLCPNDLDTILVFHLVIVLFIFGTFFRGFSCKIFVVMIRNIRKIQILIYSDSISQLPQVFCSCRQVPIVLLPIHVDLLLSTSSRVI